MEHHTPDNIWHDLDRAIAHDTVFHQFMLYTPMPGTPLYRQVAAEGRLRDGVAHADIHGQYQFNFHHPAISAEQSKTLLDSAFRADFERNGPSLYRLMRTIFDRYRRYGKDADARVRARVDRGATQLRGGYAAALWAMDGRPQHQQREHADRKRHPLELGEVLDRQGVHAASGTSVIPTPRAR